VARPRDDRQKDLLRPALDEIIDLGHRLVRLAREIDWGFLDQRFASVCTPGPGQPGLPTRLVAGLFILKHMHNLSDEVLCARWLENPYYQFFCGELSFCHRLPFDRSSLTHWRQRLGEEQLVVLIQESLSIAHKTGALATRDLERVVVDTTVQPKAVAHPTDARLCHRALEKLVELARRHQVPLRQSYRRVAKRAAIRVGRYTHAHQFKRARRELRFLRIRLGRVIRDIRRKIAGNKALEERFADLLALAVRVRFQDHRQRGPKVYALHAPEVECIGKGKARAPYEFGCKVSVATPATKPKGGQFVLHTKALHGNPFDGHTLGPVIAELEALTGVETRRIHVDKSLPLRRRGATAGTITRRSSASGSAARCVASPPRSAARCAAAPRSSRSSATSRPSTGWAVTTSKAATATASTPCSPPPATTSVYSCAGSRASCAP
jgi:transposase, IS5 family